MNYLLTALIALLAPISVAYNVPHGFLTGEAVTSHSGPNDLDGELPATDEVKREKRGYFFPSHFQSDSGLLSRSEHPNEYLKKWITHEHNRYRRMVPASDMNMLYWSDELAASAQRHADTCDFRHSRGRINVGENIWAAPYSNYSDAISIWFNEVHNPRCGCNHAYKHCCGHYVQVVWAKTNLVGCGFSRCRDVQGVWGRGHRNVFVCHYNPQGNTVFVTARGQLYANQTGTQSGPYPAQNQPQNRNQPPPPPRQQQQQQAPPPNGQKPPQPQRQQPSPGLPYQPQPPPAYGAQQPYYPPQQQVVVAAPPPVVIVDPYPCYGGGMYYGDPFYCDPFMF